MKKWLKHQGKKRILSMEHYMAHHGELSQACFKKAKLNWGDMTRAKLAHRNFEGAELSWIDLRRSDLLGANFSRAKLNWVDFRGAQLDGSSWGGAELFGVQFSADNICHVPVEVLKSCDSCTVELWFDEYDALLVRASSGSGVNE